MFEKRLCLFGVFLTSTTYKKTLYVKLTAHTSYTSSFNTYVFHESQNENKLIMIRDAATPITVEMEYEY